MSSVDEKTTKRKDYTNSIRRESNSPKALTWSLVFALCVLIHLSLGIWQYTQIRSDELDRRAVQVKLALDRIAIAEGLLLSKPDSIARVTDRLQHTIGIQRVYVFDKIDRIGGATELDAPTQIYRLHKRLIESNAITSLIDDVAPLSAQWFDSLINPEDYTLRTAFQVYDRAQRRGVVIVSLGVQAELRTAFKLAIKQYTAASLSTLFIVLLLLALRRHGRKRATPKRMAMDTQIERLEDLLGQARMHQRSMRTASSHAVQLNEQFLRKVGSDLHDGPAQSISYAILRLREYTQEMIVRHGGAEYYAIVESLEAALREIRGISKGLVLPELESRSLQQCLHKVVSIHRAMHTDLEIEEHYVDLPQYIDLGVKICVYRFVQEGLNNATRHGQATRCRVAANLKEGVLNISLTDDGMGFRVSRLGKANSRLGLVGLRDRIESIGGEFSVNSALGVGTAIKLEICLDEQGTPK